MYAILGLVALPVALAQTIPNVSLLIDNPAVYNGQATIRSILPSVSARKGSLFHFGSTHDIFAPAAEADWTSDKFWNVWNHIVAENGCKWYDTEPEPFVSNLTDCKGVQQYAIDHGCTFRGHNTFWHSQTPAWLPGNVSASDLVNKVIPNHVETEISGLGSYVTSWDVTNELIGDSTTMGMDAWECVESADRWPTVTVDGGSTPLVTNLSFAYAAWSTALKYDPGKLVYNDYSTGATNNSKTECVFKLITDLHENAGIPYSRMGVGHQSHVGAMPGYFVPKDQLETTFQRLADMGVDALITEMDMWIPSNTTAALRYQAAIWGDYIDACLYSSNCHEFINWDNRDDTSWITPGPGHGVAMPTLFDANGNPKPVYYEVLARFQRYAAWKPEMCATALGVDQCMVPSD
ncbi:glycoside hydrolase family 10 protein [Calocera viscosa TUFC12733]|uniref:Beta-xylanase n=1 Tax=Calocera viscosa (strain TUFC12733) TaxID=1330018 RepID=A0A167HMI5_CALVF|nr:glycoside hydrolase family 10 protein [Calocera viscosa TUFC12733]